MSPLQKYMQVTFLLMVPKWVPSWPAFKNACAITSFTQWANLSLDCRAPLWCSPKNTYSLSVTRQVAVTSTLCLRANIGQNAGLQAQIHWWVYWYTATSTSLVWILGLARGRSACWPTMHAIFLHLPLVHMAGFTSCLVPVPDPTVYQSVSDPLRTLRGHIYLFLWNWYNYNCQFVIIIIPFTKL